MTLQELQAKVAQGDFSIQDFQDYYKKLSQEFSDFKKFLKTLIQLKKMIKSLVLFFKEFLDETHRN